jgi:iron-sulfur cluster repair protein YtfE (RIC family)
LVDHIIVELVRHSVAEEQHLYPVAREELPDGAELADHEIAEHAEAERLVEQLDPLGPEAPEFDRLIRELIADIRHHISDEEQDPFPKLQRACDTNQLLDLGNKIEMAGQVAPTRPHPAAPGHPPANLPLDLGAA